MAEADMENNAVVTLLQEHSDPMTVVFAAALMGFTKGLWKVSGEGSGGVTRAFGEDLWYLVKVGADMLGENRDTSSPQKAAEFCENYLVNRFNVADSINFNVNDDSVEMTVKNCKVHNYTDYLEENDVPRSVGCPLALLSMAMMEEVTGEPFVIDSIESKDANSQIVLKKF